MRQLKTKWVEEFEASGLDPLPMPYQMILSTPVLNAAGHARMRDLCSAAAGQIVGTLHDLAPAAEILASMVRQAAEIVGEELPTDARR